jgi:hypothetical protein
LSFVLLCDAARAGACARVKSKGRARTSARRGSSRTRTSRIAERRSSARTVRVRRRVLEHGCKESTPSTAAP